MAVAFPFKAMHGILIKFAGSQKQKLAFLANGHEILNL